MKKRSNVRKEMAELWDERKRDRKEMAELNAMAENERLERQRLKKAFEEVEDGEGFRWMFEGRELGAIRKKWKKWKEGRARREEQGLQRWWGKKDRSSFCRGYKKWKVVLGCESYWNNRKWSETIKEQ
ncbi:hypothetical protein M0802_007928 [Mischocyttarus mexicanus]|nr:hypothetical protein M0802_007928 [Mischocyttarus mexicanus]